MVYVAKMDINKGWYVEERNEDDLVKVSVDTWASKNNPEDTSVYSREQIYRTREAAEKYASGDFIGAMDDRYFIEG